MRAALSCGGKLGALIASFDGPIVGCDWKIALWDIRSHGIKLRDGSVDREWDHYPLWRKVGGNGEIFTKDLEEPKYHLTHSFEIHLSHG